MFNHARSLRFPASAHRSILLILLTMVMGMTTAPLEIKKEISRRKAIMKNRVAPEIEEAVVAMGTEISGVWTGPGVERAEKGGPFHQSRRSAVRAASVRHGELQETSEGFGSEGGSRRVYPDRSSRVALERAKLEKQACGEIETEHPGYLGSQDTFYVGNMKGVGRIYQQNLSNRLIRIPTSFPFVESA